jgi:ElaB/YqjD/DUF883 family membrane-anchored ribosome-binding protein
MKQSVFEHVGQKIDGTIDDTTHKASRAASAVVDAMGDSVSTARRAVRDSADAATEILYNTKKRLQRNPLEAVAITFAAGIAAGAVISWILRRKSIQQ